MTTKLVKDVMTPNPVSLSETATVAKAAQVMRDSHIGGVIVTNKSGMCGMLTDRDIVVRAIAGGKDPKSTTLDSICSHEVFALSPRDATDVAVEAMRQRAVRRLPVLEDGKAVGIVSLGDLALHLDRSSALGEISAAAPNQ